MSEAPKKPMVNIDELPEEKVRDLEVKLGSFVESELKNPLAKVEKMLNNYGLTFNILWDITRVGAPPRWQQPTWYKEKLEQFVKDVKDNKEVQPEKTENPVSQKRTVQKAAKSPKTKKKTNKRAAKKKSTKKVTKAKGSDKIKPES